MQSLYDPEYEHDACGVGFVANLGGEVEHGILAYALEALGHLAHRGALDADAMTGDGSGVLTQLPRAFFRREAARMGGSAPRGADLAVGVVFLPRGDAQAAARARLIVDEAVEKSGLGRLGWRSVPVNPSCLGDKAQATMPDIRPVWGDTSLSGQCAGAGDQNGARLQTG